MAAGGGSPGSGRASAPAFAREGAGVPLVDLDIGSAEQIVAMIGEAGGTAGAVQADVTRAEHCDDFTRHGVERFAPMDMPRTDVAVMAGDDQGRLPGEAAFERMQAVEVEGTSPQCRAVLALTRAHSGAAMPIPRASETLE